MTDKPVKVEIIPCLTYVRGFMAYVWCNGFLYQVYSGPERRQVEAEARHYAGTISR